MDIFDLVSGLQKEAIKEEKLEKERRELKKNKVKENRNERGQEKDREKEKDNEEVLWQQDDFEFRINPVLHQFVMLFA